MSHQLVSIHLLLLLLAHSVSTAFTHSCHWTIGIPISYFTHTHTYSIFRVYLVCNIDILHISYSSIAASSAQTTITILTYLHRQPQLRVFSYCLLLCFMYSDFIHPFTTTFVDDVKVPSFSGSHLQLWGLGM